MATSKRLHDKLTKMAAPLKLPTGPKRGRHDMPSVEKFIKDGLDPIHAVYAFVQNITSFFSEGVSQLPEMSTFAAITARAEDEYMPSGPPMSPLTTSYFTTWAFYDLRFDGTDTIGTCLIEANDVVRMNADQLDTLKKLSSSRMGVYEHVRVDGPHVRLRELITDAEYICHIASGYRGRPGELWYVRLLPPLLPDLARYSIAFTTPYVLIETGKADWTQFLRRGMSQSDIGSDKDRLHSFLKYGPDLNYWNEFVFKGYHHHQAEAIFLAGIPDLKRRCLMRDHQDGKLKLGKGSYFVKSQLRMLPREDDVWEADVFAVGKDFWIGVVINQADKYVLQTIKQPPTVNDLARLLAEAMGRGLFDYPCRPRVLRIRERPEWDELLPHLKQIGIQVECRDRLARCDQLLTDLYPERKIGQKKSRRA